MFDEFGLEIKIIMTMIKKNYILSYLGKILVAYSKAPAKRREAKSNGLNFYWKEDKFYDYRK